MNRMHDEYYSVNLGLLGLGLQLLGNSMKQRPKICQVGKNHFHLRFGRHLNRIQNYLHLRSPKCLPDYLELEYHPCLGPTSRKQHCSSGRMAAVGHRLNLGHSPFHNQFRECRLCLHQASGKVMCWFECNHSTYRHCRQG